jgi:hypothetical protein
VVATPYVENRHCRNNPYNQNGENLLAVRFAPVEFTGHEQDPEALEEIEEACKLTPSTGPQHTGQVAEPGVEQPLDYADDHRTKVMRLTADEFRPSRAHA